MTGKEVVENKIKFAMIHYGAADKNWRVKLINMRPGKACDFVNAGVEVYKPRSRKPNAVWDLVIDTVRESVHFEMSELVYIK